MMHGYLEIVKRQKDLTGFEALNMVSKANLLLFLVFFYKEQGLH